MLMSWRTWSYFSSIANAKESSPAQASGSNQRHLEALIPTKTEKMVECHL
jgi:hypothetical protein